jgi:hypothetical protein
MASAMEAPVMQAENATVVEPKRVLPRGARRKFKIVLIKPSHYDAEGYVIQWWRSTIPSNSLASVYGLLKECAEDFSLGADTDIEIEAFDECNTVIDVKRAARELRAAGAGFIGLVGVQSNQFPRALDLARQFRQAGVTVVIGGFHVSGCISMLPELTPELREAVELGAILYAGESEGRMVDLLRDIDTGRTKPIYNYLKDMPDMEAASLPLLPRHVVTRVAGHYASFDAGRGCPFSAASAPSSMCRDASRATARPMTSRASCAPMPRRTSRVFSSPTTISPATATGSRSSTA